MVVALCLVAASPPAQDELPAAAHAPADAARARLDPARTRALERGLRRLAALQDEGGSWPAATGAPHATLAVTGASLLALLGGGSTMRQGPHRAAIKNGIRWLRDQQRDDGAFLDLQHPGAAAVQALATTAMIEAFTLSNYTLLKKNCTRGLSRLAALRHTDGGWRTAPDEPDPGATLWAVTAFESARLAALPLPDQALDGVDAWLAGAAAAQVPEIGVLGAPAPRGREPVLREEQVAAVLFSRALRAGLGTGDTAQDDLARLRSTTWTWSDGASLYQRFCAAHALALAGGDHGAADAAALAAMGDGVAAAQRDDGSWPATDLWAPVGGEAWTTAMAALVLEAPFRYALGRGR